ncbi:unnamed protein product [Owenia fusiformis]|uniref:Uncharacterized protein n=1 Tax=Owenia fusiformis TaxID=6347 RepID=A0A8J1XHX5_OWEFU|nr:unnamed protein product [Owenia fusiformis]
MAGGGNKYRKREKRNAHLQQQRKGGFDPLAKWHYLQDAAHAFSQQNLIWVASSGFLIYYTEIISTVMYNEQINRTWLYVGAGLFSATVAIAIYLCHWVTGKYGVPPDDWMKTNPQLIPLAIVCFLSSCISITVSLWPVWSYYTPGMLFVYVMGLISVIYIIPGLDQQIRDRL